ncbi:MAG: hypothetical protein ACK47B_06930 [Armatimonadota bacterium]
MSQRHQAAFKAIRREYDDVVAALNSAAREKKRGTPGVPHYDPERLAAAIATAGDAYALLLIATAEGYLREYLLSIGISLGSEPKLSTLISKSYKEINQRTSSVQLRPSERQEMDDLRVCRNRYAHGHGREVFPSVPRVEGIVSRFLRPFQ